MISESEAVRAAEEFLRQSQGKYEPDLAVDYQAVRSVDGLLIAPYNSVEYLQGRRDEDMLLDCWPILVDLSTGSVRFGELHERRLWKKGLN